MPRHSRIDIPGAIHHLSARGNNRSTLFVDDKDRLMYLRLLGLTARALGWNCFAYCLMSNHVHLLVETPTPNLSKGMHSLQGSYAKIFNARHGRTGHVFERRFHSVHVVDDAQLRAVIAYIENNPVEAGLCADPTAWPWSSSRSPRLGGQPKWLAADRLDELTGRRTAAAPPAEATLKGAWHR